MLIFQIRGGQMQKILLATIFVVCQLISCSALAHTLRHRTLPDYQVELSDFFKSFNSLNITNEYGLNVIKSITVLCAHSNKNQIQCHKFI